MIAFALQAATARAMGSSRADERVVDAPELLRVFHPPGVIRLVTPVEEAAMHGSALTAVPASGGPAATSAPWTLPLKERVAGALRRLGRMWVEAQGHRCGL